MVFGSAFLELTYPRAGNAKRRVIVKCPVIGDLATPSAVPAAINVDVGSWVNASGLESPDRVGDGLLRVGDQRRGVASPSHDERRGVRVGDLCAIDVYRVDRW
jgi:hypothetical protein